MSAGPAQLQGIASQLITASLQPRADGSVPAADVAASLATQLSTVLEAAPAGAQPGKEWEVILANMDKVLPAIVGIVTDVAQALPQLMARRSGFPRSGN